MTKQVDQTTARQRAGEAFSQLLKAVGSIIASPVLFVWAFWPYVLPWAVAGLLYNWLAHLK